MSHTNYHEQMTCHLKNIISEIDKFNPVLSEKYYQKFKLQNYYTGQLLEYMKYISSLVTGF